MSELTHEQKQELKQRIVDTTVRIHQVEQAWQYIMGKEKSDQRLTPEELNRLGLLLRSETYQLHFILSKALNTDKDNTFFD